MGVLILNISKTEMQPSCLPIIECFSTNLFSILCFMATDAAETVFIWSRRSVINHGLAKVNILQNEQLRVNPRVCGNKDFIVSFLVLSVVQLHSDQVQPSKNYMQSIQDLPWSGETDSNNLQNSSGSKKQKIISRTHQVKDDYKF